MLLALVYVSFEQPDLELVDVCFSANLGEALLESVVPPRCNALKKQVRARVQTRLYGLKCT